MKEPVTNHADADGIAATKRVALILETDLDAPIEAVWRALTDPSIVARWLLAGATAPLEAGESFGLDGGERLGGRIDCSVIESDPPRSLAYAWRLPADESGKADQTMVRFTLAARPEGGTRLKLVHDGFVVPAAYPVDRVGEEEILVLLPMAALRPRRLRRPRPAARLRRGALPTVMRLAA